MDGLDAPIWMKTGSEQDFKKSIMGICLHGRIEANNALQHTEREAEEKGIGGLAAKSQAGKIVGKDQAKQEGDQSDEADDFE